MVMHQKVPVGRDEMHWTAALERRAGRSKWEFREVESGPAAGTQRTVGIRVPRPRSAGRWNDEGSRGGAPSPPAFWDSFCTWAKTA